MKILIIAHGKTLDSMLAEGKDAAWYLVVDMTTHAIKVLNPMGQKDLNLMGGAIAKGIRVLIAASDDSRMRIRIAAGMPSVFFAGKRTVEEAIRLWESGVVKTEESPPEPARPSHKASHPSSPAVPCWTRKIVSHEEIPRNAKNCARTATPRGRHHLQQYAGRGH
jgi:hypothetical protein